MNITVIGLGYVGLSNSALLAQSNKVCAVDIVSEKIKKINARISPICDKDIQHYLTSMPLNLTATTDLQAACRDADYIIVSTPTDYDPETNSFNTTSVDTVIHQARSAAPDATFVIKSTVPVGFTRKLGDKLNCDNILFSPEFLREGQALYDNLYPSRIIVGTISEKATSKAAEFAELLKQGALKKDVPVFITTSTEAEAVKLFSNAYLALRVSFFNELDSYAEHHGLDTKRIIDGVCLDPRVGQGYSNPSFGYGGYCLPKDTKQLLANYEDVPNNIIQSIVDANHTRKDYIAEQILVRNPKLVGVYRLAMKKGSDNFRQSSILGIIHRLRGRGVEMLIHEPSHRESAFDGIPVCNNLSEFKSRCDLIVANRYDDDLSDVKGKVYTRDLYRVD